MIDDNNAAGASGGDNTSALSLDDAVAQLDAGDKRQEKPEGKPGTAVPEEPEDEPAEPAPEAEPSDEEEPPEPDEDEGEQDDGEDDSDEIVHGNAKTRLRDGTVVAVADLKKSHAELLELKAKGEATATDRRAIDETKVQLQQRMKQLDEVLPHALRIVQGAIPAEPDRGLMETDPIEYFTQRQRRAEAIQEFQQLDNVNRQTAAEQQQEQARQIEAFVASQQEQLVAKLPELKEPAKAKAFYDDVIKHAEHYGFTKEDVDQAYDHRLWPLMKDAIRYRKMLTAKPKVMEKAKDAAPVQPAGRRQAPSERRNSETSELSARLSRTGSLDDAAALLDKLDLIEE